MVDGGSLTRGEIIDILEELAQHGGATAKISAIRQLREIRAMDDADAGPADSGFDMLDDELGAKREARAAV